MTASELIEYFDKKELPQTAQLKGSTITNCESFVHTNVLRIKEGAPIIKNASTWLLKELRDKLEQKQTT